uniref:Uncharacterized protein n=1 Tax=Knipowitschia caucasica TaxID=637954 RepID=A0AAV2KQI7_KNICA
MYQWMKDGREDYIDQTLLSQTE